MFCPFSMQSALFILDMVAESGGAGGVHCGRNRSVAMAFVKRKWVTRGALPSWFVFSSAKLKNETNRETTTVTYEGGENPQPPP